MMIRNVELMFRKRTANNRSYFVCLVLTAVSLTIVIPLVGEDSPPNDRCEPITINENSIGILGGSCPSPTAGNPAPGLEKAFQLSLPAPGNASGKAKLGLSETVEEFRPSDLKTDLFVLLVFDLYCHACQQSANNMRWLNEQIENDPRLRKAAVIGLGRGDTPFEVKAFTEKLNLNFPAVSDRDKAFTDALGVDKTPSGFLVCRRTGEYRIIGTFSGYLSRKKAEAFIELIHEPENSVK